MSFAYQLCTSQFEASTSPLPPRQPPGHLNFWNIFVQISPSLVKCPHAQQNYQITVLSHASAKIESGNNRRAAQGTVTELRTVPQ